MAQCFSFIAVLLTPLSWLSGERAFNTARATLIFLSARSVMSEKETLNQKRLNNYLFIILLMWLHRPWPKTVSEEDTPLITVQCGRTG